MTASTAVASICNVQRQRYSDEEKATAVALLQAVGPAEAARQLGISKGTISSWASRAGVYSDAAASATAAAIEARTLTIAERKAALADGLMLDAQRIRAELFRGRIERKAFGPGKDHDSEVVDIEYSTSSDTQRKTAVESIAKIVETVNLLTGEATQRIEQLTGDGTPAPERAKAESTVLQLVQGSAA